MTFLDERPDDPDWANTQIVESMGFRDDNGAAVLFLVGTGADGERIDVFYDPNTSPTKEEPY